MFAKLKKKLQTSFIVHVEDDHRGAFKPIKPYSAPLVTSHCALCRKYGLCTLVRRLGVSRKSGTGGGGWDHTQGAVDMAAAWLGCKRTMVPSGPIPALDV